MHTVSTILVPIKFLLCIAQFILLVGVIIGYENHVYASTLDGKTSYSYAKNRY